MKWSNAREVTLRAVLGMLFMYLCPHLVRRQTLKTPRASRASVCMCAVNETARLGMGTETRYLIGLGAKL